MATTKKTGVKKTASTKKSDAPKIKKSNNQIEPTKEASLLNMKSINIYRKIALSFIILTVLLLAVVFYFSFVKLTITIIPQKERLSDSLSLTVHDEGKLMGETKKDINGIVGQAEFQESSQYKATGQEIIGEEVVGKVSIINNYTKNQPLVASTRLLSPDGKLFRIKDTINVPAGGSVEVEVYADKPNEAMAIGPTTFIIPGLWSGLQDKIYAESKEVFVYKKQIKTTILEKDIDQAIIDLKKVLVEKAEKELGKSYKGYNKVIYSLDENSISIEIDSKAGEEKDDFMASARAYVNIVAFSSEKASEMAREKLSAIIPDGKKLVDFQKDKIVYLLDNLDIEQGQASLSLNFDAYMVLDDGAEIIDRTKIIGLTKNQLAGYLDKDERIESYEIKFSPSFISKVPDLIDRIKIKVNN